MSRWLSQVNSLLEKLDGTVEDAIEEQAVQRNESLHNERNDDIESILARRGLSAGSFEDDINAELTMLAEPEPSHEQGSKNENNAQDNIPENGETETLEQSALESDASPLALPVSTGENQSKQNEENEPMTESVDADYEIKELNVPQDSKVPQEVASASNPEEGTVQLNNESLEIPVTIPSKPVLKKMTPPPSPARGGHIYDNEYKMALSDAREAQKESRTLRRHVVALNAELEAVEAETKAQRAELERVGERMEKDRVRAKEEKERVIARHADEIKALKKQHEQTVDDIKTRCDHLIEESRNQLREVEHRRKEEGGDWNKELLGAIEREQEAQRKLFIVDEEKATLLSQINVLQSISEGLGSRLEAMSQAADNAMLREREAEDKLDAALSMQARQLSQRQAREGELERTIADLGNALVAARNKVGINSSALVDSTESTLDVAPHKMRAQFDQYEDDLDITRNQLEHERQRAKKLQEELNDMSRERADEASSFRSKQTQYDRQLADMSVTISRLQSNLRDSKRDYLNESASVDQDDDSASQIKNLSEQIMKQQEKLIQYGSEFAALKNRLVVAVNRADHAELALAVAETDTSRNPYDLEGGPSSGGMRRRGGKRGKRDDGGSIRSAFLLNNPQNQQVETVGKAIDALDSFAAQAGKFLRANPLARGGFLFYLIILHLWTFLVLFLHAHNYEPVNGNFGAGQQIAHGPNALMQQEALIHQQMSQEMRVAVPAVAENVENLPEPVLPIVHAKDIDEPVPIGIIKPQESSIPNVKIPMEQVVEGKH